MSFSFVSIGPSLASGHMEAFVFVASRWGEEKQYYRVL